MAMAEKDAEEGFVEFLQAIWGIVNQVVTQLITAAAIAAAGAIAGTVIEPGVGTMIGLIVGVVIGAVVTWIMESLKDDIFDPESTSLFLQDKASLFEGGARKTPPLTTQFKRDNAIYELKYEKELA